MAGRSDPLPPGPPAASSPVAGCPPGLTTAFERRDVAEQLGAAFAGLHHQLASQQQAVRSAAAPAVVAALQRALDDVRGNPLLCRDVAPPLQALRGLVPALVSRRDAAAFRERDILIARVTALCARRDLTIVEPGQ